MGVKLMMIMRIIIISILYCWVTNHAWSWSLGWCWLRWLIISNIQILWFVNSPACSLTPSRPCSITRIRTTRWPKVAWDRDGRSSRKIGESLTPKARQLSTIHTLQMESSTEVRRSRMVCAVFPASFNILCLHSLQDIFVCLLAIYYP